MHLESILSISKTKDDGNKLEIGFSNIQIFSRFIKLTNTFLIWNKSILLNSKFNTTKLFKLLKILDSISFN
jgi:hypothetical protein